jgi:hypothetical protein
MIRRIGAHPGLQLAGLRLYTPVKIVRDAGRLIGLATVGEVATGSIDYTTAAQPDVVTFPKVFSDFDLYELEVKAECRRARRRQGTGTPAAKLHRKALFGQGRSPSRHQTKLDGCR